MTRSLLVALTIIAAPLGAQWPTTPPLTKADTTAIRRLAAEQSIDTTTAQLRVLGDTAWIWSRRESPGERNARGMQLYRLKQTWYVYSTSDTTVAAPPDPAFPRRPVPRDTTVPRKP